MNDQDRELVEAIRSYGYEIEDVSDLWSFDGRYDELVPLLVEHLQATTDVQLKSWIARALAVSYAGVAARDALLDEFRKVDHKDDPTGFGVRWTIGNALDLLYSDDVYDEYTAIVQDPAFGPARQMVVLGMRRSKSPGTKLLLLSLFNDPDIDGHAVRALVASKPPESARAALEEKTLDHRRWVASAARRGLRKIDSTQGHR